MWYILLAILILGIVSAGINRFEKRRRPSDDTDEKQPVVPEICCGQHEVCEREKFLATATQDKIEYYDDEELDIYSGVDSGMYSESAVNEFREVLYTLRNTEVGGWMRSLQLRGVCLPDALKDEAFIMMGK
ncbi:MAG: phospholipase [Tannerella sp.]|jgi:hypothetical protein|nr:phospholipase [Tannerella sp.]